MTRVREVYFSADDVRRARSNVGRFEWAAASVAGMKRIADEWMDFPDDMLLDAAIQMKTESFAYCLNGCPHCGKPMPVWDTAALTKVVSHLREWPKRRLTCPHCATVLPNESYPDEGQGLKIGDRAFYPLGLWNFATCAFLFGGVSGEEGLVTKLTYLYLITGEDRYAAKAIVLLDALSALAPDTIGPRDFAPYGSDAVYGRINLLTSIVHRVKKYWAIDYGWLYDRPELDRPSPALARLGRQSSVRDNIETLLNDYMLDEPGGVKYNLRGGNLTNLQNHETDGIKAMLAVGLALRNASYCDWGVRAMEAILFNTLGRDGMYYEGSLGYSLGAATIFIDIALMGMQASTPAQLESFHPFSFERLYRFTVQLPVEMLCQGHMPCYGDWKPDKRTGTEPDASVLSYAYRAATVFARYSPDAELRRSALEQARLLYPYVQDQLGKLGLDLFCDHAAGETEAGGRRDVSPRQSTLLGQAGIVSMRDRNRTTAMIRYGPNSGHCHDDALALQWYAYGKEITADIGYRYHGSNGHLGWASKSIAHNTVVVDSDTAMKGHPIYKPFAGGELSFLHESGAVVAMEAAAPELYGTDVFQRMTALVPLDEHVSYIVDCFAVEGAERADYAFHAFHEGSRLELAGVRPLESMAWTLAGLDAEANGSGKLYFDHPSRSFGERLTVGESFTEFLEDERPRSWIPDLNNGYGFIYDIRPHEAAGGDFAATWSSTDGYKLQLFGMGDAQDQLIAGQFPNLEGDIHHPMLVWRSHSGKKLFQAVMQTFLDGYAGLRVEHVKRVDVDSASLSGLIVELSDGATDYWVYGVRYGEAGLQTRAGLWHVAGRCAWLRVSPAGDVQDRALIQGAFMRIGDVTVRHPVAGPIRIESVDVAGNAITLAEPLSDGTARWIRCRSARTGKTSAYRIHSVEADRRTIRLADSLVLSKGVVERVEPVEGRERLASRYPMPLGSDLVHQGAASPFEGRTIRGSHGGVAVIRGVPALKVLEIEPGVPFRAEEPFDILGLEPGDVVE